MKFIKIFFIVVVFLVFSVLPVLAADESNGQTISQGDKTKIYFFWAEGCPHCKAEKAFLSQLTDKCPNIQVMSYEVSKNKENSRLLDEFGLKLDADTSGVPFTVVSGKYIIGWYDNETTGKRLLELLKPELEDQCPMLFQTGSIEETKPGIKINVPLVGEVNLQNMSLFLVTVIVAGMDGFNPCAMWVLVLLIGLLLGMKDRKRMWILGASFIVASGFVYFLFLSAWLNLFLFIGFIIWVRLLIGSVAIYGGYLNLKDYVKNKEGTCEVVESSKKKKITDKMKDVVAQKNIWVALGSIVLLAFGVNLIELFCSAGLPAVYTQLLALTDLAWWQYYAYLLLYIVIFMLDDMIVFAIAMKALHVMGITGKYSRASKLIGGLIMLIIGILMILKPELLTFG